MRSARGPTAKEREDHELTHMPYCGRCETCVRTRGLNGQHRSSVHETIEDASGEIVSKVPVLAADYAHPFGRSGSPHLIMIEEKTGAMAATRTDTKGPGCQWAVPKVARFADDIGLNDIVFKSDGEVSILAVGNALRRERGGRTIRVVPGDR